MREQIQGRFYIRDAIYSDRTFVNNLINQTSTWVGEDDFLDYFNVQRDDDQAEVSSYIIERERGGRQGLTISPMGFRHVKYYKVPKIIISQISLNAQNYPVNRHYFDWLINHFPEATDITAMAPNAGLRTLAKQRIPEITNDSAGYLKYHIRG